MPMRMRMLRYPYNIMIINIVIVLSLNYIAFSFINLDVNFSNWEKEDRIYYVVTSFLVYTYKYKIRDILYSFRDSLNNRD